MRFRIALAIKTQTAFKTLSCVNSRMNYKRDN